MAGGMEAQNDLGARRTFDAEALGADGHAAIRADLERRADAPNIGPRGKAAIILRGPAVLELAFPINVERLPADPDNYWRDLRLPRAQFEFPFSPDPVAGAEPPRDGPGKSPAMISRGCAGAID